MSVEIIDLDLGFKDLEKALGKSGYVDTGYFANKDMHPESQMDLAEIAIQNEFGTLTIPERSFMRSSIRENERQIIDFVAREEQMAIDGKQTVAKMFDRIGIYIRGIIQKKIATAQSWAVPNAPSTVDAKGGRETPLVDTSFMMKMVDSQKKVTKS